MRPESTEWKEEWEAKRPKHYVRIFTLFLYKKNEVSFFLFFWENYFFLLNFYYISLSHFLIYSNWSFFRIGKADLSKYREASSKIFDILGKNFRNVEKASIDEAYVDLTEQVLELDADDVVKTVELVDSYVLGTYYDTVTAAGQQQQGWEKPSFLFPLKYDILEYRISICIDKDQEANLKAWLETVNKSECSLSADRLLALGALLVQRTRQEIFSTLGFHCSAGIAHNKTLAKLCAGLNKPNKQTILPFGAVQCLYQRTPINKM